MKVAHISHTNEGAGAGRAAYRLHRSLLALGVDSRMLVADLRGGGHDDTLEQVTPTSGPARFVSRLKEYGEARLGRAIARDPSVFFSPTFFTRFEPQRHAAVRAADVVALYWINSAFVAPEALAPIGKPIVWRLSDVWPFTGGCHYPGACTRYEGECGACPQLARPGPHDVSRRLWRRKARAYGGLDLTVAAPSEWIARKARASSLFAGRDVRVVPTGVDLDRFKPMDPAAARAALGLPEDKKIVVFGALSPTDDVRKGFVELRTCLEILSRGPHGRDLVAVAFGSDAPLPPLPLPTVSLGRLREDAQLRTAYSAADIVIVPSLEDNLPNVALEAIACGAPVAGFAVGGMPDIVNGETGVLADSCESLAAALQAVLADAPRLAAMRPAARAHARARFSSDAQASTDAALNEENAARPRARGAQP